MAEQKSWMRSARRAAAAAMVAAGSLLGFILLRVVSSGPPGHGLVMRWGPAFRLCGLIGLVAFVALFAQESLLAGRTPHPRAATGPLPKPRTNPANLMPLPGFVALEQNWMRMSRTYIVFIAPEGLFGWCVHGPAFTLKAGYFEPFEALLEDEDLAGNRAMIEQMSSQNNGFFLPRARLRSLALGRWKSSDAERLPNSGCLSLSLSSGGRRELVLLGLVRSQAICDCIATVLAVPQGKKLQDAG